MNAFEAALSRWTGRIPNNRADSALARNSPGPQWARVENVPERVFPSAQYLPQTLAIQGPGVIVSFWPDWVILLYVIGVELIGE